jgi:hypothetical protein
MASHGTLFGDARYGIITIREKAVTTVARFKHLVWMLDIALPP